MSEHIGVVLSFSMMAAMLFESKSGSERVLMSSKYPFSVSLRVESLYTCRD